MKKTTSFSVSLAQKFKKPSDDNRTGSTDRKTWKHRRLSAMKKIENLEKDFKNITQTLQPQIHITCGGQVSGSYDNNIPKFHWREHNPTKHLRKIHKFHKRGRITSNTKDTTNNLIHTLELCLKSHVSRWLLLIKDDARYWQDFQTVIEQKYWSRDVQRGIRQRMEIEKYLLPQGKLSVYWKGNHIENHATTVGGGWDHNLSIGPLQRVNSRC